MYDLKGTYPADQFFDVNAVTGSINLIKSLTQDGLALGSYTVRFIGFFCLSLTYCIITLQKYFTESCAIMLKMTNVRNI